MRAPRSFPCARCGRPLRRTEPPGGARVGRPARIACPRCKFLIYDYPRPCAGMVVIKGDTALVLRRAFPPRKGCLDIPGGFLEAGETIEGAARRELLEETSLKLGAVRELGIYWDRYYLSGFGWFPTMNFYFVGRWKSGTARAGDDAASAEWIPISRLGRTGAVLAWKHMSDVFRDVRRVTRG